MKRLLLSLGILAALATAAWAFVSVGVTQEGNTTFVDLTFGVSRCSTTATICKNKSDCPSGETCTFTPHVPLTLAYRWDNVDHDVELLPNMTVPTPASTYEIVLDAASVTAVGTCTGSLLTTTYCKADAECGSGNTCTIPKNFAPQNTVLTVQWTYPLPSGTPGQGVARIPIQVNNVENYPFPVPTATPG